MTTDSKAVCSGKKNRKKAGDPRDLWSPRCDFRMQHGRLTDVCRNPDGCHCREIASLKGKVDALETAALASTAGAGAGDLPTDLQEAIQRLDAIREEEHRSLKDGGGIRLYRIAPAQSRAEELSLEYVRSLLSAVPASPRSGAGEPFVGMDIIEQADLDQAEPGNCCVGKVKPPAPAEHGVGLDSLRAEMTKALDGHTRWSRDCNLTGEYLCGKVWPLVLSALSQGGGAGRSEKGEGGGPHRILEAANTLNGEWALTIAWPDRTETVEIVGDNAAAALGYVPEGDDA